MANATTTTVNSIVRKAFPQRKVLDIAYKHPLLAMLPKKTDQTGLPWAVPIQIGHHTGRSALFAKALANKNPNLYKQFSLNPVSDYVLGNIDTLVMRTAKGPEAIVAAVEQEMKGMSTAISNSLAFGLFGNGGGAIGKVASGSATTTLTLTNPQDIVKFEVGMRLDGASTDGTTGSVVTGGTGSIITAINADTGTITRSGNPWNSAVDGITGLTDGTWWLFQQGDFGAKISGLDAWIPATAPVGGDSFGGVDRSVDTRLSGCRLAAGATIQATLLALMARAYRDGGLIDHIFVNPTDYRRLVDELSGKVQYIQSKSYGTASAGFSGVQIVGEAGPAVVYSAAFCPSGFAYGLQMDTWLLASAGDCPGNLNDGDRLPGLRDANSDSTEFRLGYYAQLLCYAPWKNGRAVLP